jgi:hypothetical protein
MTQSRTAPLGSVSAPSARPALLVIALGAWLGRARQQLRRCIERRRESQSVADLNDWLLRDIGVIRERTTLGIRAAGLLPLGNDMVLVPDRSAAVHDRGLP